MKKRLQVYGGCVLFFLSSCTTYHAGSIHMEDVAIDTLSFDSHPIDSLLIYPQSINVWKNYLIVMEPQLRDSIYSIWNRRDFAYQFSCGRKGSGPNELINPRDDFFACTDSSFFILDSNIEREVCFQNSTLLVKKVNPITIPDAINQLIRLGDDHYVSAGLTDGSKGEHIIYQDGEYRFFGEYPDKSKERERRFIVNYKLSAGAMTKEHIYDFYLYKGLIRSYSIEGELLDEKILIPSFTSDSTPVFYQLKCNSDYIVVLYNNKRYTSTELYTKKDFIPELQLWNWNGELKQRIYFDAPFDLFTISADNILYAMNSERPTLIYTYDLGKSKK